MMEGKAMHGFPLGIATQGSLMCSSEAQAC